ncbi:hypothetical protein [Alcaligenes faecalis]|uniref:hypothetical protein n=1 Tax=Alcaligenes faecalis TaxID=511 RepID=UPI001EF080AC|nr:hypothetical protein [Alcaligenes faecalis]ULH08588.1 hypothetical protein MF263_09100 [Alcaligenes faecalis]
MNVHKSIAQVFENNMGNRITPELAAGMIRSLIDILAAGVQQRADVDAPGEPVQLAAQEHHDEQEGNNGLV